MVSKGRQEGVGRALMLNAASNNNNKSHSSMLERAFEEKSETLARVLPASLTDPTLCKHMAGLLFYQVRNLSISFVCCVMQCAAGVALFG